MVRTDHFPDLIEKGLLNVPVIKPKKDGEMAWYEKISKQWGLLGHQIKEYIGLYATAYYGPYLRTYEAFKDILEEVKKKDFSIRAAS